MVIYWKFELGDHGQDSLIQNDLRLGQVSDLKLPIWLYLDHPIITNPYKSAKNEDTELKFQDMTICITWHHLRDLPSPGPTWHNVAMTYYDHGHPIETNPYKLAKH